MAVDGYADGERPRREVHALPAGLSREMAFRHDADLDAVVTPGTTANIAATFAVTTLLIPRIPNRTLAVVTGFAAGAILRG
ncbi:MAG: hypothetical protein XE10_0081 [Methanoculleus marisnigri]|uniref:Uncharacterized protein n=1 Tax=Methanoculleus marisnigri TaxID=2198 RepID=A0A101J2I8_9EURY|nr:MAG: hypothetical protein XD82_0168 [Methanoculleus marisnigri]KUL05637.1 MAG: hypothetical protein XE10_0081 [Methanoculleus marisnigri]